jgi:hypothetical protein
MNVLPGGYNLLALATQAIGFSSAILTRWKGNVAGDDGILAPTYYAGMTITASIQPTPRTLYQQLGLDLQKDYLTVYTSSEIQVRDIERNTSSDLLDFDGKRYQAESHTPWTSQNGWRGTVFICLGKTSC